MRSALILGLGLILAVPAHCRADGQKQAMSMAIRDPWAPPPPARLVPFALDIWPECWIIRDYYRDVMRGRLEARFYIIHWKSRKEWVEDNKVHVEIECTLLKVFYPPPGKWPKVPITVWEVMALFVNGRLTI
jgi:hypothetical protein